MNSKYAREVLSRADRRLAIAAEKYGFSICPWCEVAHTAKTILCRGCGFKIDLSSEQVREIWDIEQGEQDRMNQIMLDQRSAGEFGEMECPWCGELRDFPFLKCPNPQCSWERKLTIPELGEVADGFHDERALTLKDAKRVHEEFMREHPEIKDFVEKAKREMGIDNG